jgi:hypothetical protein
MKINKNCYLEHFPQVHVLFFASTTITIVGHNKCALSCSDRMINEIMQIINDYLVGLTFLLLAVKAVLLI